MTNRATSRSIGSSWDAVRRPTVNRKTTRATVITTGAIERAITIRVSVVTTLVMCSWTVLSYRAASNGRSSWTAITATRSMARRAARSPQRVRSGWCRSGTCATLGMRRLTPATTVYVTCETRGWFRTVSLDGRERAVTLTPRGRRLLDAHRRDVGDARHQAFHAGVSRPRELTHDASLYRAYLRAEERLREQGGEVRRVVLEQDLKTEYQRFLQEHNRGRSDSDGRPDRDPHEVEAWARDHELPYFDESVHFPDFRIEYELDGRDAHEDIEVLTEHYRGAHAGSRVRAGFSCYGGRSGGGGRPFDPRVADEFL